MLELDGCAERWIDTCTGKQTYQNKYNITQKTDNELDIQRGVMAGGQMERDC